MLQRLFSGNRITSAVMIIILGALLWIPSFMSLKTSAFYYPVRPMPLYGFLAHGFEGQVFLSKIFAFLFLLFQAVLIVRLNARFILIQERTLLPAFFFLLITAFYMPLLNFSEAIFGSFFFIIMLDLLFSTYKKEPNTYRFFEAGLVLGIASLFYARLIYFLPFIWIVAVIIRPFYWREWLYPVLGAILPYVFIIAGSYVAGGHPMDILVTLKENLVLYYGSFEGKLNYLLVVCIRIHADLHRKHLYAEDLPVQEDLYPELLHDILLAFCNVPAFFCSHTPGPGDRICLRRSRVVYSFQLFR